MKNLRTILAVLLALFAILTLFDRFVLVELLLRRTAVPLLLAGVVALAMMGLGALLRRGGHIDPALDLLLGYPILGTLLFLVGTMNVSTWSMLPLVALGALAAVALLLRRYADDRWQAAPLPPQTWPAVAVMTVVACGFVAAQAPPSSLDELAYHLAVPRTWVLEGRAIDLPLLSHSYFPLGIESADLPLLVTLGGLDGGEASHFLHLFAAVATILLVARRTSSWLATAAIATTPALAVTAGWSLVDWPLAGLFVALYVSLEEDDLWTASLATAAGLLAKYTFGPFALMAFALKRRVPKWIAAIGGVFFIRNLFLTGNPVAPFFAGDSPHVSGYRALALSDYIFEGTFIDEALGASMLSLAPFAAGPVGIGAAVLAAALFLLGPSARILVPYLLVPALSAAPQLRRRLLGVLVAIAVVVQTFLVVWFTGRTGAFSLLAGSKSEQEYLRERRASSTVVEWLNTTLPRGSRALVVGLGETYWFAHPVRGAGNFDGPRVSRYLDVPAPAALRERLRKDGITHVAVVTLPIPTGVEQKLEERQTVLAPDAQKMLARTLDSYAGNVVTKENAALFTLK